MLKGVINIKNARKKKTPTMKKFIYIYNLGRIFQTNEKGTFEQNTLIKTSTNIKSKN